MGQEFYHCNNPHRHFSRTIYNPGRKPLPYTQQVLPENPPNLPEFFTIEDGVVFFRPVGETDLAGAVDMVDAAIQTCRRDGIAGFIANTYGLTGFECCNAVDRFYLISRWAATSGSRVVLCMVVPKEMIDREKFGVLIASNRGMESNVFADENEALGWLGSLERVPSYLEWPAATA
jgi:hypothetical protein